MSTTTHHRLYRRDELEAARSAWDALGLRAQAWRDVRHRAAIDAGLIVPPAGHPLDSWTDDHPSELAIVARQLDENPELLWAALRSPRVRTWAAVLAVVIRERDARLEAAELELERDRLARTAHEPTRAQATASLRDIMGRLA